MPQVMTLTKIWIIWGCIKRFTLYIGMKHMRLRRLECFGTNRTGSVRLLQKRWDYFTYDKRNKNDCSDFESFYTLIEGVLSIHLILLPKSGDFLSLGIVGRHITSLVCVQKSRHTQFDTKLAFFCCKWSSSICSEAIRPKQVISVP